MSLPKKKKVRVWCPGGGKGVGGCEALEEGKEHLKKKFVRCSECGQRFETKNVPTCCPGDIHREIPRHKAYGVKL